jgi:hypothetical protein
MATVNVAIVDKSPSDHGDIQGSTDAVCLQLLAIKSLSKFIGLVMEKHVETISLHLTTIVVSLIPVLEDKHHKGNGPEHWAVQESQEAAVSLLETLTNGGVGRILTPYFKEIPFLPSSIALKNVHRALQSNRVDFDNLLVLSSATSQGRQVSLKGSAEKGAAYLFVQGRKALSFAPTWLAKCLSCESSTQFGRKGRETHGIFTKKLR